MKETGLPTINGESEKGDGALRAGKKLVYFVTATGPNGLKSPPSNPVAFVVTNFDTRTQTTNNAQWARFHLSYSQFHAAVFHTQQSIDIELAANWSSNILMNHRACVMAAISSSVSYLEALINELYIDAVSDRISQSGLNHEVKKRLALAWGLEVIQKNASILEKYRYALRCADAKPFSEGINPFQDIKKLIELRNSLTHNQPQEYQILASPEADPTQELPPKKLAVLAQQFSTHPARTTAGVWLGSTIENCLYGECARWAVSSSINFADAFLDRMNIPDIKMYRFS